MVHKHAFLVHIISSIAFLRLVWLANHRLTCSPELRWLSATSTHPHAHTFISGYRKPLMYCRPLSPGNLATHSAFSEHRSLIRSTLLANSTLGARNAGHFTVQKSLISQSCIKGLLEFESGWQPVAMPAVVLAERWERMSGCG